MFEGFFYISTFEGLRYICTQHGFDMRTKALIAGAAASVVGQTIIVPFDVISQHLMVLGACTKTKVCSYLQFRRCRVCNFYLFYIVV